MRHRAGQEAGKLMRSLQRKPKEQHNQQQAVSLWLDDYTDIFSDFDPRPFAERTISDDFVLQVKKLSRDIKKVSVLRLLLPEGLQREEHEHVISKRLHIYFNSMYEQLALESKALRKKGMVMTAAGILLMVIASYIYYLGSTLFPMYLLLVLLEPGGWFLFWNGLDNLITYSNARASDIAFFNKMAMAHVDFSTYNPAA